MADPERRRRRLRHTKAGRVPVDPDEPAEGGTGPDGAGRPAAWPAGSGRPDGPSASTSQVHDPQPGAPAPRRREGGRTGSDQPADSRRGGGPTGDAAPATGGGPTGGSGPATGGGRGAGGRGTGRAESRRGNGGGVPAEDRDAERGLRGLIGSGTSQVNVRAALRARDASRPTAADLAEAQERLVVVRRNWVPREDLPRNR
ncbi:hypothetical protein [Polymorphospora rubra]|uniref:Uncharacterized protein n=1 Tax=Polymorphospora rubra TaxID=338584 RepID=A0A810MW51_9ACTN|nr:hypothetical protein [Polymorphospora rubra]BCJ63863.1 hypothetical protein Prubr_08840 [Polymorphospora rubra]